MARLTGVIHTIADSSSLTSSTPIRLHYPDGGRAAQIELYVQRKVQTALQDEKLEDGSPMRSTLLALKHLDLGVQVCLPAWLLAK